jgi:hypothetical protein
VVAEEAVVDRAAAAMADVAAIAGNRDSTTLLVFEWQVRSG